MANRRNDHHKIIVRTGNVTSVSTDKLIIRSYDNMIECNLDAVRIGEPNTRNLANFNIGDQAIVNTIARNDKIEALSLTRESRLQEATGRIIHINRRKHFALLSVGRNCLVIFIPFSVRVNGNPTEAWFARGATIGSQYTVEYFPQPLEKKYSFCTWRIHNTRPPLPATVPPAPVLPAPAPANVWEARRRQMSGEVQREQEQLEQQEQQEQEEQEEQETAPETVPAPPDNSDESVKNNQLNTAQTEINTIEYEENGYDSHPLILADRSTQIIDVSFFLNNDSSQFVLPFTWEETYIDMNAMSGYTWK